MTENNQDSEELAKLVGNKQTRKDREKEFKDVNHPFKNRDCSRYVANWF